MKTLIALTFSLFVTLSPYSLLATTVTSDFFTSEGKGNVYLISQEIDTKLVVSLYINAGSETVNALEAHLLYDVTALYFEHEEKSDESIVALPRETEEDGLTTRYVSLSGITGSKKVAVYTFTKKKETENPKLSPNSLLLLADGRGTDIYSAK